MTMYDECCNQVLPTEPAIATTTITTTEPPTTEISTTLSVTTTEATSSNETSYTGDGYCDDSYEACQEERNFWGSITSEQVIINPLSNENDREVLRIWHAVMKMKFVESTD